MSSLTKENLRALYPYLRKVSNKNELRQKIGYDFEEIVRILGLEKYSVDEILDTLMLCCDE